MQNNCHYVNDGIYNMGSNNNGNWEFVSEDPTGDWIELNFPSSFMVDFIRIWESSVALEKNLKEIELSFDSNAAPQMVSTTSCEMLMVLDLNIPTIQVYLHLDYGCMFAQIILTNRENGSVPEEFNITAVFTTFVRFTILSSYANGQDVLYIITEIEIYNTNPSKIIY